MQPRHAMMNIPLILLLVLASLAGCAAPGAVPSATPLASPTPAGPPPTISAVTSDRSSLGRYERIELTIQLSATYTNPFDSQEVALSASFRAPSGTTWQIPGFWDGRGAWRVRFTPSEVGTWQYLAKVQDRFGEASSSQANFAVVQSDHHGWIQVASWHDPKLSSRYLAYHDGTPFYGIGHCDAFTLGDARLDSNGDLNLLKRMRANGENLVVWWPHNTFTFFQDSPSKFDSVDMGLIDSYLQSADRLGMTMVYTIWDHNLLRGAGHPWGAGRWEKNGFNRITPKAEDFFTDPTSWRWQENLYRYVIARWGYSPAIIWMTVSEIDGTSGGANMDTWHAKVNQYFVEHDPYRHPTTASLSGDKFWTAGYAVTDLPQVHLYEAENDAVRMGDSVADWTNRLWKAQARPNLVGEFGTTNSAIDLALVHNGIWAGLVSGAAITPLRWSDRDSWGRMRDVVMAQMSHFAAFVADVPFPSLAFEPGTSSSSDPQLRVQALVAPEYALVWAQDRATSTSRAPAQITIANLKDGQYRILPFDTWNGQPLAEISGQAQGGKLTITLPPFQKDIALKIVRGG